MGGGGFVSFCFREARAPLHNQNRTGANSWLHVSWSCPADLLSPSCFLQGPGAANLGPKALASHIGAGGGADSALLWNAVRTWE